MIRKSCFSILLFSWLFISFLSFAQTTLEPLPIDPQVRYGKLANGLTYYIRHNKVPENRADFYIVQNVGSILEEENQRGLAHFLEHMAFNGSKHFPKNAMDDYTESQGMRLGENLNAYTGFDETVYLIRNAPTDRSGVIDSCLLILHDWSNFLLLEDDMIEKERGIIREEWRTGQDAQARLWEQQLPKMFPDSRYANRLPIGSIDVINNFKPEELREYYRKWYRPDLQAIIVVGDIDVDQTEATVKSLFSDIPAQEHPAERVWYGVPDSPMPLISVATDKEASSTILYLFYKHDKMPSELYQTVTGLVKDYIQNVAGMMMNERFSEMVQQAEPPFVYAEAGDGDYMVARTKEAWTVAAMVQEGKIESTMTALVTETMHLKQYGFTTSEYERARINMLKLYESAYNERDKQQNSSYTNEYVNHFTQGGYIPGIEVEYNLLNMIAPQIPVEQVNNYIQDMIEADNIVIALTGPEKEGLTYPSDEELLRMYLAAKHIPVEAYVETVSDEPLIPQLPEPGEITEEITDPLFDATIMTLSNGIKVVLKQTDFKTDQILMTATSPGGTSLFGDEDAANLKVLNEVIHLGGLGNFSAIDLGKRLAGKQVSCTASIGLDNESLNGSVVPLDLETLFELIYLQFTAVRMDNDAYASYTTRMKAQLENLELDPMVAFSDSLTYAVYMDNPRAKRIQAADFDKISYPRVLEMYNERFADASDFVFTFVGNIDLETIRPFIKQYLATLPSIKRIEKGNVVAVPEMRKGTYQNNFKRSMEVPKSSVVSFYSGQTEYSLKNALLSTMLKQILDLVYTEKIREDEGATYGVQVSSRIATFPEGQLSLQIYFDTDPNKRPAMASIIAGELRRIGESGPREGDFLKTQDNMLKRHAENLQENGYWLNTLDNYYYKGFDESTAYEEIMRSLTPTDIRDFAKQILNQDNRIEVIMEP